jgi:hypothetical protein
VDIPHHRFFYCGIAGRNQVELFITKGIRKEQILRFKLIHLFADGNVMVYLV